MPTPYTIQQGDTLGAIASSKGTDVATLQKLNPNIADPNKIYAGANLNLPDAAPQPEKPQPEKPVLPPSPLEAITGGAGKTPAVQTSESIRAAADAKIAEQAKKDAEATAEAARLETQSKIEALKKTITPEGSAPTAPGLETKYKGLLSETDAAGQSYTGIQANIVDLNKQKADAIAELNKFKQVTPEGVSAGFAQGAISKEQQAVQDKVDFIDRQINTASLQLSNRADTINTIMGLTKEDYTNASARYDKQLTTNLTLFNALGTTSDKLADNARANLQIIQNDIKTGAIKYDAMTQEQRATVQNLEVQAGYPTGFTRFVTANVKGDVISSSPRTAPDGSKYMDVLTKKPDGSYSVTSVFAGKERIAPTEGSSEKVASDFLKDIGDYITKIDKGDLTYEAAVKALKGKYGPQGITDQAIYGSLGQK